MLFFFLLRDRATVLAGIVLGKERKPVIRSSSSSTRETEWGGVILYLGKLSDFQCWGWEQLMSVQQRGEYKETTMGGG